MINKEDLLSEILETKYSIQNNNLNIDQAKSSIQKIDLELINSNFYKSNGKSNIIKSIMITFNISNFSDLTVLFITSHGSNRIIDYAGNELLLNEFKSLLESENHFYKDLDTFKLKGDNFRIFHESMENNNGIYTIITITESVFFKPTKFHMLCDIMMDIIRSSDMSSNSVFNDLFEDSAISINNYIAANNSTSPEIYLFKFENIYDFFLKMGLEIIIELSAIIKNKLTEVFSSNSSIIRFSLSKYIVISSGSSVPENRSNNLNYINFAYKGIVLHHRCIKIPYVKDQSIYDIFENIFLIDNDLEK